MELSRRAFLAATPLWATGLTAPAFWRRVAAAAPPANAPGASQRVLVVIELTGGNDGLNTVIPIADPEYAAARPTLRQRRDQALRVQDELALHPALTGLARLLERSQLAIVQGVGYPHPNRSHFVSMDFWHTAALREDEPFGWLGRILAGWGLAGGAIHVGDGESPLALAAPSGRAVSLRSLAEYQLRAAPAGRDSGRRRLIEDFAGAGPAAESELLEAVRSTARETYRSAERLRRVAADYDTPVAYPTTGLGQRLKLVAQLLAAEVPDRLFYTALNGFDTHADQARQHGPLLAELGDAVAAFQEDVRRLGQEQRVLTLTFSEFGRRVRENGSLGTDHGAASQMFIVGEAVRPGPLGSHPSLTDLTDGDLKYHTDFRSVYATVLEDWLDVRAADVLQGNFAKLPLLKLRHA